MKHLALPALLALAACGQDRPVLILPPAELAQCSDEPQAPDLPRIDWESVETAQPVVKARDAMMLTYVLAMRSAWGDCRAKVEGLATWREEAAD